METLWYAVPSGTPAGGDFPVRMCEVYTDPLAALAGGYVGKTYLLARVEIVREWGEDADIIRIIATYDVHEDLMHFARACANTTGNGDSLAAITSPQDAIDARYRGAAGQAVADAWDAIQACHAKDTAKAAYLIMRAARSGDRQDFADRLAKNAIDCGAAADRDKEERIAALLRRKRG